MNPATPIRGRRRLVALATVVLGAGVLTMQPGAGGASVDGEARAGGIVRISSGALRLHGSGARELPGGVEADRHDLRAADDLPGQAAAGGHTGSCPRWPRRIRASRATGGRGRSRCEAGFASATARRCGQARSRGRSTARWRPGCARSARSTRGRSWARRTCQAGRTTSPTGVVARGNRLVVRFTRPVADFPAQTTMPFFCAVPPTLPADPEGVSRVPGRRPVLRGRVPRRAAGRDPAQPLLQRHAAAPRGRLRRRPGTVGSPQAVTRSGRTRRGRLGLVGPPSRFEHGPRLAAKYGINRSRFFVTPGLSQFGFGLNTSRPLFRNNARLRRAVNFAIDRRALSGVLEVRRSRRSRTSTCRRGCRDSGTRASIRSRPTLRRRERSRAVTRAAARSCSTRSTLRVDLARAQIVAQNLAKIGLDVEVKAIPPRVLRPAEAPASRSTSRSTPGLPTTSTRTTTSTCSSTGVSSAARTTRGSTRRRTTPG